MPVTMISETLNKLMIDTSFKQNSINLWACHPYQEQSQSKTTLLSLAQSKMNLMIIGLRTTTCIIHSLLFITTHAKH